MHYVKQFKINGVDTKQVACIELQGAPNAATEGSLGVLGIDITSPTHDVYKCVAVNGSIYTWELLSSGMSIMSATITGEGGLTMSFPYSNLLRPSNYLFKIGDLILDSEGYLYRITAIGTDMCDASYCGTHIGGIASGDKDYKLAVNDGKLQLVTESGRVISTLDYLSVDNDTLYRNPSTGATSVLGVKTIGGDSLRLFVGTKAEYDALTDEQKANLFAIITDDNTKEDILAEIGEVREQIVDLENELDDFKANLYPTPTFLSTKKLPSAGYYYISVMWELNDYCYGLVYWDGKNNTYCPKCGSTFNTEIWEDGTFYFYDNDGNEFQWSSNCRPYVAKVGG